MRDYVHLGRWVEWCGPTAVDVLVNIERAVLGLAVNSLGNLRSVPTPQAATKVLSS